MLTDLRVAVVGAGAMGEAIIGGLLRQELVRADQIIAAEPREERRNDLHARYGIGVSADNGETVRQGDIVIIAVKPQVLAQVLAPLCGMVRDAAVVISIVAGASIQLLAESLAHAAVVRTMPNTPAQVGAGMTVWTASAGVTERQREWTRAALGVLGREVRVDNETYLDMATAINGSGPGYIFLMIEAMIDAGVHLGLPRDLAQELVVQTILGSALYVQQSDKHPAQLRNAVTSPGGTTAAALSELERGGLRTVLGDAIWAAYRRSVELGKRS